MWTADDIGDQSGRIVVVTGGNSGIGLETARQMAVHGATVVLAVRRPDAGRAAADDIASTAPGARVEVQQLDLASLASVEQTALALRSMYNHIDVLVNNAGVMYTSRDRTVDGYELQFATNHLGHFALTVRLLDLMTSVPGSRVVTVGSLGHRLPSTFDIDDVTASGRYHPFTAYARSKLANVMFGFGLQRRLAEHGAETISVVAHPGGTDTELANRLPGSKIMKPFFGGFAQEPSMGALPSLRAATDPTVRGGDHLGPDKLFGMRGHPVAASASARANDRSLQDRLWERSEELTDLRGVAFAASDAGIDAGPDATTPPRKEAQ